MSTIDQPRGVSKYHGYRSWDYLEAGKDFTRYRTVAQPHRVEEYVLPLTEEQSARVDRLLRTHLIISLHDHVTVFPEAVDQIGPYARSGRVEVAYEGLRHSGLDAVFDNLAGPTGCIASVHGWKWDDTIYDLGLRLADIAKQDYVVIARRVEDILEARARGQVAMILGMEGASPIENELDRLDMLFGFGIRQIGLVYNDSNLIGGGMKELHDGGLTRFGRKVVERSNALGMMIDLSHTGDRTALEAIELSTAPVAITHAGARGVWPSERMKPDVVLRELAAAGGLLGIEAAPHSTISPAHPRHSIASVMDHFDYCVELMGIEHVTFGPDAIFADHSAFHEAMPDVFSRVNPMPVPTDDPVSRQGVENPAVEQVPYVEGAENPAEAMRNLIGMMVIRGYSDEDIARVAGGNTVRVLKEIWA